MTALFLPPHTYKTLSLWQPFASLVARGVKRYDTRHWATPYRGPVAIHAAKTLDIPGAPDELCASALGLFWPRTVPISAIVAVAELVAVHDAPAVKILATPADLAAGSFSAERYAWEFANVRALRRPIPLQGRQGLFNWTPPEDLVDNLLPGVDHFAECHRIGWAA